MRFIVKKPKKNYETNKIVYKGIDDTMVYRSYSNQMIME